MWGYRRYGHFSHRWTSQRSRGNKQSYWGHSHNVWGSDGTILSYLFWKFIEKQLGNYLNILIFEHFLFERLFSRSIAVWFPNCRKSNSSWEARRLLLLVKSTFLRYCQHFLSLERKIFFSRSLENLLKIFRWTEKFKLCFRSCANLWWCYWPFGRITVSGDFIRQNNLLEWFHGHRYSATQRTTLDPRRRFHRTVLHRIRHGTKSRWFCSSKIVDRKLLTIRIDRNKFIFTQKELPKLFYVRLPMR